MVQQTTVTPSKTERSSHKKKDIRIKGPKIRHPPEPVHPNVIFLGIGEGDKGDTGRGFARLYRDMIRYSISDEYRETRQKQKEQGEPIGFLVTDIGYWVLDHNPDYIDYYRGSKSKTPDYIALANSRQTLKSYLEHLQKWSIVKRLQEVDAKTRNGQKTWLYDYGRVGVIIARILEYRDKYDDDGKQEEKNEIFDLIQRMFNGQPYNSYKEEFLAEFYRKLIEYDNNKNKDNKNQPSICDSVIRQIISSFQDASIRHDKAVDYFDHLQTILLKPVGGLEVKQTILTLYQKTLDEVPEDIRRMTMYHDKYFFESKMLMSQPPKEWSTVWEKYIANYDMIVACGRCLNKACSTYKQNATFVCDYYSFISTLALSADTSYSEMECSECKNQKSFHIYNSMNSLVDGIMTDSF